MGHPNPARRSPRGFQISDVCNLYFPRLLCAFIVTVPSPPSVRDFNMRPSKHLLCSEQQPGGCQGYRDEQTAREEGSRQ